MRTIKRCIAIYPPMLDIFVNIEESFLLENGVALDAIVSYSEKEHHTIHDYVMKSIKTKNNSFTFRAGGATFNTQKILSNWLQCYFFGIIGCDAYGEIIEEKMQNTKVNIYLDKRDKFSTSWAYVFINNDKRANIALQDSSVCYSDKAKAEIERLVDGNTVFYFVSFMFVLPNIVKDYMAVHINKEKIGFCAIINLSSQEMVSLFRSEILEMIRLSDFIIGNKSEYYELSKTDNEESLIEWLDTLNVAYAITDGSEDVIGKIPNGPLRRVSPKPVSHNAFTNGAGDSFAAGFIGALKNKEYKEIVDILPLLQNGVDASYQHITSRGSA
ncbi:adenosine kinase [Nematocida parisii]|uniref:Adenosine kinase n=1 Tax=Nematocida parisii (strain ERTm3) TaxID=935791 RepID=I3EDB1_NEMP3|nr:uncharacterized protein NEPG_00618 [Nematocida parisii ERTm1]EIJ87208.1 hypothetical protein NEQG_02543 [Nematocida parisii ERTm3]KAI5126593.1 adenosine kinase [Nematocida parisii]EIJ95093.1 hypothetical protein NEPG_00618 [Nematocida parisii ERTm1]KAI5127876.1 adenosine kinase [Nematocida parisii]KAI5143185.1 adenosine kinase [Nematocida parisii]|eukprot:XP_013058449.1 hypothetical protein NEPG_00618 [Nematocida parisii ERTm1]